MDQNQQTVDNDLQKAIDNIPNNTNIDPVFSDPVAGWTSTICIILLLGGIQLFSIGILGKYLEKTYTEVKKRPIYIVKESNIDEA